MRIVLAVINAKWIHPSLALRLLKANLGDLEKDCEIMEFALRQNLAEKTAPILAARPELLGLSVSVWNHLASIELLDTLNDAWERGEAPRPRVVLGGPEVSFLPEDAALFRRADFVIRGEGEFEFRKLCESVLAGLPAVERRAAPRFAAAAPVSPAEIKTAYHYYRDVDLPRKLVYVEAGRGCPYRCEFCLSSAESSRTEDGGGPPSGSGVSAPREFPLESFLADMDALLARGARNFKFLDRSFNHNVSRARAIMEFFLEWMRERRPEERPRVHFEMIPSRFPPELRETIRRFPPGTLRIETGIQTFNRKTAALIRRPLDEGETASGLEFLAGETEAIIHADLIAGLPGESLESFGAGFDRLRALLARGVAAGRVEIQAGILKLLPGAAIARHTEREGMKYSPLPPYEVMESAAASRQDMDRLKNFARFHEIIVNRGHFPAETAALFPPEEPAFLRLMELADRFFARFGRNWGIDRKDLRSALSEELPHCPARRAEETDRKFLA